MNIKKIPIKLHASAKGVITHFLFLPGKDRITHVINRLTILSEDEVEVNLDKVMKEFAIRHRDISKIFLDHINRINNSNKEDLLFFSERKRLLLGAYFTKEYS